MGRLSLTYDGHQHVTAIREPQYDVVAIDCPYTGKGQEFSPASLLAVSLASCMLLSMGALAERHDIDLRGTTVDVKLKGMEKRTPHVDTIFLAFDIPHDLSEQDRMLLERAACICPVMGSFCSCTEISTTYNYGAAKAA